MPRKILALDLIAAAIRDSLGGTDRGCINEIEQAMIMHNIVVVGMAFNPYCRRARQHLIAAKQPFQYLEYGSYFSQWQRRLAIKMWTGWPTFPQVFIQGKFIGGEAELRKFLADNLHHT